MTKIKQTIKNIDKFFMHTLTVLSLLTVSLLLLSIVIVKFEVTKRTLSSVGYEYPILFAVWGIITATVSFFGLRIVADKVLPNKEKTNNAHIRIMRALFLYANLIACCSLIVTVFVFEDSVASSIYSTIHLVAAKTFGVLFVFSLFGILFLSLPNNKHNIYYLSVIVATALYSGVAILTYGMTAERQFAGLIPSLLIVAIISIPKSNSHKHLSKESWELGIGS